MFPKISKNRPTDGPRQAPRELEDGPRQPKTFPRQPNKDPSGLKKGPRHPDIAQGGCKTAQERPKTTQKDAHASPKRAPKSTILKTHVRSEATRSNPLRVGYFFAARNE